MKNFWKKISANEKGEEFSKTKALAVLMLIIAFFASSAYIMFSAA